MADALSEREVLAICGRLPVGKGILDGDAVLVGAAICSACCCGTLHGRWPYPISEHEELQDSSTNAKLIWRLVRVVLK